jgi:4-amino-4-deoxy-L-arabinose transferase-like glycosyltransferase
VSGSNLYANLRQHWPFLIVATIGAALIFANLGSGYLWADEGDTAVLGQNIVKFGLPRAWDGKTFMDSDFGARVNRDLVMVSSPWLQYYVAAASFAIFGETTLAARLPFALAGWFTIGLVYLLVWKATNDRRPAICASILTVCSVQFLLFCRQSRYYTLAMLLTCLVLYNFLRMRSFSTAALFGVTAVLLFHTQPIGILPVIALGGLTLIDSNFSVQRRWFWLTFPAVLALTIPWFFLARTGYTENALLVPSVRDFFLRLVQCVIECASVSPLIGISVLLLIVLIRRPAAHRFQSGERALLIAITAVVSSLVLGMVVTQRSAALWVTGIRYASAIVPLLAIAAGLLMWDVSRGATAILTSLVMVFTFTKFAQITPWIFWADKNPDPENKLVALHVPSRTIDAFLPTEDLLLVREMFEKNIGTLGQCVEFLRQHAAPDDLVITNYESEPLYFHTGLPQGLKIARQDSIYDVARRHDLPEYIFGVDHARWVVWRFNWDDYLGFRWPDVAHHLIAIGGQISNVAEIKETGWENRENIHFHRFPGDVYLFPQDAPLAPAKIFRVNWTTQ